MNAECFVKPLGFSPCEPGPVLYSVTLPDLPKEALNNGEPFELFSCPAVEHLGHAVAGAARNGSAVPVVVTRLR